MSKTPYRVSTPEMIELVQLKHLLENRYVKKSVSPWGAPFLIVKKKDDTLWMCIDHRQLRKVTEGNKYHFPRMDDLFDQMRGSKVFSKIEFRSGDQQVRIKDEYVHKTTSRARYGSYELVVVPFGFTNAPATFMCLVNNVFSKFLDKLVLVILDGILIYSKNEEEHVEHLRLTLKLLRKHKLYAGMSKCDFDEDRIHYLGNLILDKGIDGDVEKIDAMMSWPTSRKLTNVGSFVDLKGIVGSSLENIL